MRSFSRALLAEVRDAPSYVTMFGVFLPFHRAITDADTSQVLVSYAVSYFLVASVRVIIRVVIDV